ncbi:MAG: glycosyltransferase 87 family protein [Chloroflexota bacterium]
MPTINPARLLLWLGLVLAGIVIVALFVGFFEHIPIENTSFAIDWHSFHQAVKGGNLVYAPTDGLRVPPWSALFIMPLGFFSFAASWGLLAMISFGLLVFSVPRVFPRWKHLMAVLLLTSSFLALRLAADGNFEGFIVAGAALIVYAYRKQHAGWMALGVLLATFKPQAVVLLLVVIAVDLIAQPARRPFALKAGALVLAIVIPSMLWRGEGWLASLLGENYQNYTGNYLDISLSSALTRLGLPAFIGLIGRLVVVAVSVWIAWRPLWRTPNKPSLLSREKAGMLIAASLLISPYAAGNTVLVVLAIGVIPLFQKRFWLGGLLILLSDAAIFLHNTAYLTVISYYWTAYLVVVWAVLAVVTWNAVEQPTAVSKPGLSTVKPMAVIFEPEV